MNIIWFCYTGKLPADALSLTGTLLYAEMVRLLFISTSLSLPHFRILVLYTPTGITDYKGTIWQKACYG